MIKLIVVNLLHRSSKYNNKDSSCNYSTVFYLYMECEQTEIFYRETYFSPPETSIRSTNLLAIRNGDEIVVRVGVVTRGLSSNR